MVRILLLSLSLYFIIPQVTAQNQYKVGQKKTFSNQDIFHSAVFLENNNIVDNLTGEDIHYYVSHDHIKAFFTDKGIIYQITSIKPEKKDETKKNVNAKGEKEEKSVTTETNVVRMDWIGANPHPQIIAEQKSEGYYTYLKKEGGSYKTLTTTGYKSITYKDIYPGIDVVYTFPDKGGMEYSFEVHPGADVNLIKFKYSGSLEDMHMDVEGNIVVHTLSGDIIEHKPSSHSTVWMTGRDIPEGVYVPVQQNVSSSYSLKNNVVLFNLPNGYDGYSTLTIDPWVTTLTSLPSDNMGFDADYDSTGNLFVYGAGPTSVYDLTYFFFEAAKYDTAGTFLWAFNGGIPAINWNSSVESGDNNEGSFMVDKITGKVYLGQGYDLTGSICVRLNSNGQYDNFSTTGNDLFVEIWGFAYNCSTQELLALGGGTTSHFSMGVVNPVTGAVNISNITGIIGNHLQQDIICGVMDSAGNLYVIMNSDVAPLPYTNTIYKIAPGDSGNVWAANSHYTSFTEVANVPFWDSTAGNWNNALAANGSYLYYYDGSHVAAYNFADGSMVGSSDSISGYTPLMQGGIAVDYCNHVYVGGVGVIKTFTFDGTNFTAGADISLGTNFQTDAVHDIKYNATNNLLYITGDSVVGTFVATLSSSCTSSSTCTPQGPSGIEQLNNTSDIRVYPNPLTEGNWTLEVDNEMLGATCEIYDAAGKLVYRWEIHNLRSEIELNVASGVYLMHVNSKQQSATFKIIRL